MRTPLSVDNDRPFVDLEVTGPRGTTRARFLVDTAGGGMLIRADLASEIGLATKGTPDVEEWGIQLESVVSPRVALSGSSLTVDSPAFVILDAGAPSTDNMFPGRALAQYQVVFDFPKGLFELRAPGTEAPGMTIPALIHPVTKFPRIVLEIDGEQHGMLLDTGAGCTMISPRLLEQWRHRHPDWTYREGAFGSAVKGRADLDDGAVMVQVPQLLLGSLELRDVWMVARQLGGNFEDFSQQAMTGPAIGALGGNALKGFRVVIDYPAETMYLERSAS